MPTHNCVMKQRRSFMPCSLLPASSPSGGRRTRRIVHWRSVLLLAAIMWAPQLPQSSSFRALGTCESEGRGIGQLPRLGKYRAPTFLTAKKKSNHDKDANDWGIPYSDDLPPLGPTKLPLPRQLANGGKVTLVGSGPGDPDLLTLSAHKLLTENKHNKIVIADRLVSPEILQLIQADDVKIARKLPGCADLAQEEIYWWTYQALNRGQHVIRLKIGDPFVFGRGGEEVQTFRRFGVEAQVIPGVSSAFSAPLLGNIPVTHRGVANQVVMCTGYGREGTSPDLIQYHDEQTVVFLMAVGRLRELCANLLHKAHYPVDTPVGIVEKAGCPDQRMVVGTLSTIPDLAVEHNIQAPAVIVVGKVVNVLLHQNERGEHVTGLIQNCTSAFA